MIESPLERAVKAAGGQSAFARLHGVSQPSVWAWIKQGKALPAELVLKTEAETGVSRHELRPDLYPLEESLVHGTGDSSVGNESSSGKSHDLTGSSKAAAA